MKPIAFPNLDWFLANFDHLCEEYQGAWLAIVDQRVVAHAQTAGELSALIRQSGIKTPFITRASREAWGADIGIHHREAK